MLQKAIQIIKMLQHHGYQAVLAGGCVRDSLLLQEPHDYDIATNAQPKEVERLFPHTIPVGKQFGVIIVNIDGDNFDVATFRKDGEYLDGRHPKDIQFASMKEDALRRDFTINALFWDPIKDQIYDYVNGMNDINKKIIRFVGNPWDRIHEDKLRIMRAIRFAGKYLFGIDVDTYKHLKMLSFKINDISQERITEEILKALQYCNSKILLETWFDTNLMYHILPEVALLKDLEEPEKYHPEKYTLIHTSMVMHHLRNDDSILILAGMLHDIGKPYTQIITDRIRYYNHANIGSSIVRRLCDRLKLSNEIKERLIYLVKHHMDFINAKRMKKSTLKKYMAHKYFDDLLKLFYADIDSSHKNFTNYNYIIEKKKEFEQKQEINPPKLICGKDLIDLGLQPGPQFSEILSDIWERQLELQLTTKDDAMKYIRETYIWKKD